MAVLYITEYVGYAPGQFGNVSQAPIEPPLAEQTVAIGGSSAASSAFNANTTIVRLHTDAICSVKFGTAPTATTSTARMAANQTEFKGVTPGQSLKVAVISNT